MKNNEHTKLGINPLLLIVPLLLFVITFIFTTCDIRKKQRKEKKILEDMNIELHNSILRQDSLLKILNSDTEYMNIELHNSILRQDSLLKILHADTLYKFSNKKKRILIK